MSANVVALPNAISESAASSDPLLANDAEQSSTDGEIPDSKINSERVSVVPESLLALAKDARYLFECQQLLQQIKLYNPWWSLRGNDNHRDDDDNQEDSEFYTTMTTLLLYIVVVVLPRKRTLGMEVTGLTFASASSSFPTTNHHNNNNNNYYVAWKLLGGSLVAAALWQASRRLERVSYTSDHRQASNSSLLLSSGETLRGHERRLYFERQRQAMLQQATAQPFTSTATDTNHPPETSSNSQSRESIPVTDPRRPTTQSTALQRSWRHQLQQQMSKLLKIVARILSFPRIGSPHEPSDLASASQSAAIFWWLRLHLAWYCLGNGRSYASWMHRFLGLTMIKQSTDPTHRDDRLVNRPNIHQGIGLLILAQAVGTFVPEMGRRLMRWWMDRTAEASSASHRTLATSVKFLSPSSLYSLTANTPCDSAACTSTSPSLVPPWTSPPGLVGNSPSTTTTTTTTTTITCLICRQVRKDPPACSITCGHVFCWHCLQQWVSMVRPECPLCRAPCRPQQVLALYHYHP